MTTATATKKPAVQVRIEYDEMPFNPREEQRKGHGSVFGHWHRRDSIGDEKIEGIETVLVKVSPAGEPEKITDWFDREQQRLLDRFNLRWTDYWDGKMTPEQKAAFTELRSRLKDKQIALLTKHCVCLPVFMLDHSGVKLQTMPFNIAWDSGQVGFIWIDRENIKEQWGWTVLTNIRRAAIAKSLEGEIEVYSQYVSGDCYYVVLEDEDGEEVDSFGGTYGTDWDKNGIKDGIPKHLHDHTKWKFPWH